MTNHRINIRSPRPLDPDEIRRALSPECAPIDEDPAPRASLGALVAACLCGLAALAAFVAAFFGA